MRRSFRCEISLEMSDQLAHDHRELDKLLDELQSLLQSGTAKEIHRCLDFFWARLAVHIRAEHLGLFPAVIRAFESRPENGAETPCLTEAQSLIAELRQDHDFFMHQLSRGIASVRTSLSAGESDLRNNQLANLKRRIAAVTDRLASHNKLEEEGIYLWVGALLSQREQSDLRALVREELANLPPRFVQSDLSDYLATD